jgi:regulator of RNase E activity RraA
MRDLGDVPEGFQIVAGSIGPSHGFVHVKEVGTPVTIFGMQVTDGDLIHADRHGAIIIPIHVLPTLEAAIHKLLDTEKLVLDPARQDGFDFEAFKAAWIAFEGART